jgi:hypothetical protein
MELLKAITEISPQYFFGVVAIMSLVALIKLIDKFKG